MSLKGEGGGGGVHDPAHVHESKYVFFRLCKLSLVCRNAHLIALLMNQSEASRLHGCEICL